MPVPPKPAERRQRSNKRDVGPVVPAALPASDRPSPPPRLLKATQAMWVAFWASEQASLVLPADRSALERLFGLMDERTRAAKQVGTERVVTGSTGQLALHPLLKYVAALDAEIRQLEDRFGLTPLARLRLGVTFGEAHRSLADLNRSLLNNLESHDDPRND